MSLWPYDDRCRFDADADIGTRLLAVAVPNRSLSRPRCLRQYSASRRGLAWFEYSQAHSPSAIRAPLSIAFAFVATHNHFVLDRGGKVFNRSAPVIKLPEGATEDEHLALLGVLNSSTACFWLKQNSHNKGNRGAERRSQTNAWEHVLRVHRHDAAGLPAARRGSRWNVHAS